MTDQQMRGPAQYDDGKCLICVRPGHPGAELIEGQWRGRKVWLCPQHHEFVELKMRRDGLSQDAAIDQITKSVMDALFSDGEQ